MPWFHTNRASLSSLTSRLFFPFPDDLPLFNQASTSRFLRASSPCHCRLIYSRAHSASTKATCAPSVLLEAMISMWSRSTTLLSILRTGQKRIRYLLTPIHRRYRRQ
jgi:hypothetical protein